MEQEYLISDVLTAMEKHELKAFYQPKYDATTRRLKSAEALVRWEKEDGTVIPPDIFLPAMEQTDIITRLDWYMLEEVCSFLEKLIKEDIEPKPVSINFSRWHLREPDMPARLSEVVDSHHLDHRLIVVEITESAMIHQEERLRELVTRLHEEGFRVSVDDFGSGLSSLSLVADILVDEIKIDQSLLRKNCEDERERIILESIFLFANRLHIQTVAEGVETKEQLGFLRSCNCDQIQGFYFDRPIPAQQYETRLLNNAPCMLEDDILQVQSPAAAEQLLLDAVCEQHPLIIYINLSRNSFYMMSYENFSSKSCPSTGEFDDLIYHGALSMHPEDREEWKQTFSRENQLQMFREGRKSLRMITRQIGDDGIYRKVQTNNYFVKSPASEDVLVISLCNNLQEHVS